MKFTPNVCEHCKQTTDYAMPLDRGSALIVLAVSNAMYRLDRKFVHLVKDMEGRVSDFGTNKKLAFQRMIEEGYMTPSMRCNAARPRYHGLIAFAEDKGAGTYLLTKKGREFLGNARVPRVAVIDKATGHKKEYAQAGGWVTCSQLLGRESSMWNTAEVGRRLDAKFPQHSLFEVSALAA